MTVVWVLVGLALVVAVIAGWRVIIHDKAVRGFKFGFFFERDRDDDGKP